MPRSPIPDDIATIYADIGRNVRHAREAEDMTQEHLATRIGLTRTSIVNIEQGRQRAPIHTLIVIADALHVPPALLIPFALCADDALLIMLQKAQAKIRVLEDRLEAIRVLTDLATESIL